MDEVSTISIVLAAASVIVAAIVAVLQLRNVARARNTDIVLRMYSVFTGKKFQDALMIFLKMKFKDYDDYLKRYPPTKSNASKILEIEALSHVGNFFDTLGILMRRKLIDAGLASDFIGDISVKCWEKMKPVVEGLRKARIEPRLFEGFEYLYNEMKKR